MAERVKSDLAFLQETIERGFFPERLTGVQRSAFTDMIQQDMAGKMAAVKATVAGFGSGYENQLVSDSGVVFAADWALLVATRVEFETCVSFFEESGFAVHRVELGSTGLAGRLVEYSFSRGDVEVRKHIYLQRTSAQGSMNSSNLAQRICSLKPAPRGCFLVGSCGAIPTKKLRILDVIVPCLAIDGTKFSLSHGEIVPEPGSPFVRHARITNLLTGLTTQDFGLPGNSRVETDKELITAIGKWDSLDNDVSKALLSKGENIVAVEMEGVGMVGGLNAAQETGVGVAFGIAKGAADYCSTDELNELQLTNLRLAMPSIPDGAIRPTSDPEIKFAIQKEATRRSVLVALTVLERL